MATPRTIHKVIIHLGPNRISEGYYTLDEDLLTMTYSDGSPVILSDGRRVTHDIKEGDNLRGIAAVLTGEVRKSLVNELVPGFGRDLDYPPAGNA
jgi:hypothetical protein